MASYDLQNFAKRLLTDAKDEYDVRRPDDLQDVIHEIVDGAVPIYYGGQLKFLNDYFNDVFHTDVSELASDVEMSISSILPIAIYMAIDEACNEVMDKVFSADDEDEDDDY